MALSPELQLLVCCPLSSPCSSCCSSPKTSHPVEEAPSLASDSLNTQHPSYLPSVDGHLRLLAPLVPPPPSVQLLLVLDSRGGEVFDQNVDIFRSLAPCPKDPSSQWGEGYQLGLDRSNNTLWNTSIFSVNLSSMLAILVGQSYSSLWWPKFTRPVKHSIVNECIFKLCKNYHFVESQERRITSMRAEGVISFELQCPV